MFKFWLTPSSQRSHVKLLTFIKTFESRNSIFFFFFLHTISVVNDFIASKAVLCVRCLLIKNISFHCLFFLLLMFSRLHFKDEIERIRSDCFPETDLMERKWKEERKPNIVTRWDASSSSLSLLKAAIYLMWVSLLAFFVCGALNC